MRLRLARSEDLIKTIENELFLFQVLKSLYKSIPAEENGRMYTYLLSPALCGLIVPAEVEAAVRAGQLESVSGLVNNAIFIPLLFCLLLH